MLSTLSNNFKINVVNNSTSCVLKMSKTNEAKYISIEVSLRLLKKY